jgi:hypothetical protein
MSYGNLVVNVILFSVLILAFAAWAWHHIKQAKPQHDIPKVPLDGFTDKVLEAFDTRPMALHHHSDEQTIMGPIGDIDGLPEAKCLGRPRVSEDRRKAMAFNYGLRKGLEDGHLN